MTTSAVATEHSVVQGHQLLDDVSSLIRRYVVMAPHQIDAIALWVVHTWAIDAAYVTPYLAITSPVSESGKSTLLRVLEHLVQRPWRTGRVTPAVLARRIDGERPTLLLDELDAALGGSRTYNEVVRGILNEGFTRGGVYSIVLGGGYRDFSVFGPKALAGIGRLPDTIASRSIPIRLRRRRADEAVTPLDAWALEAEAAPLRDRLGAWAAAHVDELRGASPALAEALSDRASDMWRPLGAIATLAGGDWPERARASAAKLSERGRLRAEQDEVRVLAVARDAFGADKDRLSTSALAEAFAAAGLISSDKTSGHAAGHAVTRLLKPFEVGPAQKMRIGVKTSRAYSRVQFEDAWERYL